MVSEQFDRCHGTLLQYVEFLCSAVTPTSTYALLIPTLDELVHQYHLDPEVAFLIYRPVMRLFRCPSTPSSFWPLECNEAVNPAAAEKEPETSDSSTTLVLDVGSSRKPISWINLLDTVKTMLPAKAWNSLSPDLYATFWGLTLYDLYVPRSRYESEIAKLHSALKALEEFSDNSSSAIAKRKKDKERIQESLDRLTMELQKHEEHVESSDESIYERECGNMPGFAVYYRYPNSQRVTYGQFIKVHWKWSQRITRLLIQCLESTEYMEIRNALIMLTKISGVFPVTRKSGINLEKRVAKIKSDEREDLKVLATGVAAALAARKPSWVTDEEFGMGYLDIKPAPAPASKSLSANATAVQNGAGLSVSQAEQIGVETVSAGSLHSDSGNAIRDPRRPDVDNLKQVDELANKQLEENTKVTSKTSVEPEARPVVKRSAAAGSLAKQAKQDLAKEDDKSGKAVGRTAASSSGNAATIGSTKVANSSARPSDHNTEKKLRSNAKSSDSSPAEEHDRLNKRRKGESDSRDIDGGEVRLSEKERSSDLRAPDKLHAAAVDKTGSDEQNNSRVIDKPVDRSKDKSSERYDRDYRERLDRPEKSRADDFLSEKLRDRSLERHGRERSVERVQERGADRNFDRLAKDDRSKDDRSKVRYGEPSVEKSHVDDRFHGQSLPPPPPLPPHVIPQSVNASRRDEDGDRRIGNARHTQKLSPRHDERERRRSEENASTLQDDTKRRREDEFRDRKRDERDAISIKMDERERDKANTNKEDIDSNASKRRKLKREHMPSEPGEYLPATPTPPPVSINLSQSHDGRDRGDRKGVIVQRSGYIEEPGPRIHSKEAASKATRRDPDPMYDREWDDDKRQRAEPKRRHRK
ncbi:UNVERIFIED_CONTAM: THO complex subunit [Sesamum radiatum]|uniref:THO complex subunit n=1 Tax=Sesamum radiatum TaxID=300843 RepID=A0AAW2JPQ4_SESRA